MQQTEDSKADSITSLRNKFKMWNGPLTWEKAEKLWDEGAQEAAKTTPIKSLKKLPKMPGVTKDTAHLMRWKALKYMVRHDEEWRVLRHVLKHPLKYTWGYLRSLFRGTSYERKEDFFFYNLRGEEEFIQLLEKKDTIFVLGFSYCHKPFECPSGRFSDQCIADAENAVCRQCFIGKCLHASPNKETIPLVIPTVHYISEKIFEVTHAYPDKQVTFLITACEMTLKMFADWGNMAGIRGIGVRLDGRICNTMKAFELSEAGIKPGLTVVLKPTQKRMLELIRLRKERKT